MFESIKKFYSKVVNYLENASWVPGWIKESNRVQHFVLALPAGFIGSLVFVLGLALGMEFKDKSYGGKFDWLDILATVLGGILGQILQAILLIFI